MSSSESVVPPALRPAVPSSERSVERSAVRSAVRSSERPQTRSGLVEFRYVSTRNFRGRRSFSARETIIDTSWTTSADPEGVAAGLGREKPACQY